MKKTIIILLGVLLLGSCTKHVKIGIDSKPFVVKKVIQHDGYSEYQSAVSPSLLMPSNLWEVGDTISLTGIGEMSRAYRIISSPQFNGLVVTDTSETGFDDPYMRVDSIFIPSGIAVRYVKETNRLDVGYDSGILFGQKR